MQICMDRRRVNFDWNRARAFLVTAEEGSFSAASRALGIAQTSIGRQVAALESELDVRLFERIGRGLVLTPTGLELVEQVRSMAESATRVSRIAAGQSVSLDGPVCVSATDMVAAFLLPPILAEIRSQHPGIEIEVVATSSITDLSRREADVAIRNVRPSHADLVVTKVRDAEVYLYATPGYLASLGNPSTLDELSRAEFIDFDHSARLMTGLASLGLHLSRRSFPWVCDNQHVQWALVTQGSGVGIMHAEVGDSDPRVQRVLPDLPPLPFPLFLTAHREVRTSRRVRVVFDLLAKRLREGA